MKKLRDNQRSRVYKAEQNGVPKGKQFVALDDCRKYYDRITNSAWWKRYRPPTISGRFKNSTVASRFSCHRTKDVFLLKDGRRRRKAAAVPSTMTIKLPRWARFETAMLHELAHMVQTEQPWHGAQFARIYIDLVTRFHSDKNCGEFLKASFRKHGVVFHKEA